METFNWNYRKNPRGQITHRTLKAQFGDGYAQEAEDGINSRVESWPLEFFGREDEVRPIKEFLDRHKGWKRFYWTPPLSARGTFKTTGEYQVVPLGGGWFTLSVVFESRP
ncbi:phage tail protein [Achromobacter marplatensis]|uniref:Phage tail protein n=1 Tax=Achromobacter marplatensis TaxID=470868 RepID=A0AA43B1X0_9BURK|nr:phage tail protein [Achromobacter marplatensis]MDH2051137.1 phage tail protein [Achromobacter marplatensis]